ncbi:MAG TPA: Rv1535 family protein [Mycobacterium sp.]|jgi:hypothetical protein
MTAAFYDEVITVAPVRTLKVVRDTDTTAAPKTLTRRAPDSGGDPLVNGAARLLSIPLRHVYAALWRAGVLEVQA